MNKEEKNHIKFKIITISMIVLSVALSVIMLFELIKHNENNKYWLGLVGMAVLLAFSIAEPILIAMSGKKEPMIIPVAFDGEDRDRKINKMPFYFVIGVSIVSFIAVVLTTIFFFVPTDEKVTCMCIIVLPIMTFVFINTIAYFVCIELYRYKEMSLEDMINYDGK